jgi:hypothetical protein
VGYWLNLWAQATGLDVRFDVINSGRQGFRSGEIAALVRFEVLPFEPDLVVYYEGSNQFYPNRYVKYPDGQKPRQPRFTLPLESWIEQRSALARRVAALFWSLRSGEEPPKNMGTVEWPKELNEVHPELSKRSLFPSQLGTIVDDLDYLRKHLAADGSELILSTFVWMVEDGMVLKLPEQTDLYQYLNVTFWPFTYAHMRRYADFQNRVLTEYARQNSIELLDIAAVFPRESSLFYDAIHMPEAGLRLRAWITTQMLIPAIEQRLASGRLPRPPRAEPLQEHPILSAPPTRVTLEELRSECR